MKQVLGRPSEMSTPRGAGQEDTARAKQSLSWRVTGRFEAELRRQPVVEVAASTEGGEALRGHGVTTENIRAYLMEEQRRPRGCIAGRMPALLPPRVAKTRA